MVEGVPFRLEWIGLDVSTSRLPLGEHGQQHGEVDGSWSVGDHGVELGLGSNAAQFVEGGAQVVLAQDAILVAIHQLESLLEFSHLFLAEHGEDIASRSLHFRALLRSGRSLGRRLKTKRRNLFIWFLYLHCLSSDWLK